MLVTRRPLDVQCDIADDWARQKLVYGQLLDSRRNWFPFSTARRAVKGESQLARRCCLRSRIGGSQMKFQMKREALEKLNRHANEMPAQKAGELAKAGAHTATVTVQ